MARFQWRLGRNIKLFLGGVGAGAWLVLALLPRCFAGAFEPNAMHGVTAQPPAWGGRLGFSLGTDDLGRDLLARLICGAETSIGIGMTVVLLAGGVGTLLGLVAAQSEGWVDRVIMRLLDLMMMFPSVFLAIVVVSLLGPSLKNAVLAVSVVSLPRFARVVRAVVCVELSKAYVHAARCFGASEFRLMVREVLPNCAGPVLATAALTFAQGILDAAALGFLGLGATAPTVEWGTMLADARPYFETAPWSVAFPGLCIMLTVLAFNVLADGLQEYLNPRLEA